MRQTGIFCGTFDPIHFGHIHVAKEMAGRGRLDRLVFVPSRPLKARPAADKRHRLNMISLALDAMPNAEAFGEDAGCDGPFWARTMLALSERRPGEDLACILGADRLAGLLHSGEVRAVAAVCRILVYPRAGFDAEQIAAGAGALGAAVEVLPVPPSDISSSLVRSVIGGFGDALDMIPQPVSEYIALNGLYKPAFDQRVRSALSEKRYLHTLGTRDTAVRLAGRFGASMQKAAVAGLLHDCAKCMKLRQLQAIAKKYRLTDDRNVLGSNALLHGIVGAQVAKVRYGIDDEEILNAIRYHTTGRPGMSRLELCVYVADAIEPSRRDYPGLEAIRALSLRDLRAAALSSMLRTREYVLRSGKEYFADTLAAINDLSG